MRGILSLFAIFCVFLIVDHVYSNDSDEGDYGRVIYSEDERQTSNPVSGRFDELRRQIAEENKKNQNNA